MAEETVNINDKLEGLAASLEFLQKKALETDERIKALEGLLNEDLLPQLSKLESSIPETKPKAAPAPTFNKTPFKSGGASYALKVPSFLLDNKTVTEQEVLQSPALQKRLVEEFPGLLSKV